MYIVSKKPRGHLFLFRYMSLARRRLLKCFPAPILHVGRKSSGHELYSSSRSLKKIKQKQEEIKLEKRDQEGREKERHVFAINYIYVNGLAIKRNLFFFLLFFSSLKGVTRRTTPEVLSSVYTSVRAPIPESA